MERIPTPELLDAMRQLGESLGRAPKATEMDSRGEYSSRTYKMRFGSWNEAVIEAGYEPNESQRPGISRGKLVDGLVSLAEELGHAPTATEMRQYGEFSVKPYQREFGSWNAALDAAGFELHHEHNTKKIVECENCGAELLRTRSRIKVNEKHYCDYQCQGEWLSENNHGENHWQWQGGYEPYYGPGWRKKRQEARDRDGYRCQRCGMAQADHIDRFGAKIHVHHIRPVREFEDKSDAHSLDNLVTLCSVCHRKWEGIPLRPETATGGDER